ncbi:MAG: type I-E CRISPR-associated protein Cas6/Cse3/CasE [Rhodospirillaceae bacterium]
MSAQLYLSRLTLKTSPEITPLINVLQPRTPADAIETDHRLIWAVMPEDFQREQHQGGAAAFLWRRDDKAGRYFVLGPRPRDESSLFEVETKPFEARLGCGDRLEFVLRVNATVDRRTAGRTTRKRSDVAMDLLRSVAPGDRPARRHEVAEKAACDWLGSRADKEGFALDALHLDGYRAVIVKRNPGKSGRIGVFDLRGLLTVTDPPAFLARLASGFGRAKAFGCGLMLVRRAG